MHTTIQNGTAHAVVLIGAGRQPQTMTGDGHTAHRQQIKHYETCCEMNVVVVCCSECCCVCCNECCCVL
jgi:uncharacterized protein YdiU (UPF0061 family)